MTYNITVVTFFPEDGILTGLVCQLSGEREGDIALLTFYEQKERKKKRKKERKNKTKNN